MNKIGQYHDDERGHYSFNFSSDDGKHITVSFRAEPDYDLDVVFSEFKNFLIASGHDVEGKIGELGIDEGSYDEDDETIKSWSQDSDNEVKNSTQSKFSMDHLPNNGWPFGNLTTVSLPALTSADFASLTVTNLETITSHSYSDWAGINKYPTMAPITQEQTFDFRSKMDAPGTIGGAKVSFK